MKVAQYVMAYRAEQDRLRAMLPEGFTSLRPVLRINAEIRTDEKETVYLEYNTPVEGFGKRGWLNIAHWENLFYEKNGKATTFHAPFPEITYTAVGIVGGCPAEGDDEGCFFQELFVPTEKIDSNKAFCNCSFQWKFAEGDAHGISVDGKSVPAPPTEQKVAYEKQALTAENAAAIPCEQVLGSYVVAFER